MRRRLCIGLKAVQRCIVVRQGIEVGGEVWECFERIGLNNGLDSKITCRE